MNKQLRAAAAILAILQGFPESERLDVLATVCAAYCQTNGRILSPEARRSSRETVLGPLKRKKKAPNA